MNYVSIADDLPSHNNDLLSISWLTWTLDNEGWWLPLLIPTDNGVLCRVMLVYTFSFATLPLSKHILPCRAGAHSISHTDNTAVRAKQTCKGRSTQQAWPSRGLGPTQGKAETQRACYLVFRGTEAAVACCAMPMLLKLSCRLWPVLLLFPGPMQKLKPRVLKPIICRPQAPRQKYFVAFTQEGNDCAGRGWSAPRSHARPRGPEGMLCLSH